MSERDPYLHRTVDVLRNRLGILDVATLDRIERRLVTERTRQGIPKGKFDLKHLQAIHRHLFQDVFDWAGQVRTVEISKDGHQFQFCRFIETGMADVHRRLVGANFLRGLDGRRFAQAAGEIIGDVNYVHPFREGNGRSQLQYLKQLGAQAGHAVRLDKINPDAWVAASRAAHRADYGPMVAEIAQALGVSER